MNLNWYDKVMLVVVIVCFTLVSKMVFDLKKSNYELKNKEVELQALKEENSTLREAIKNPATTTQPSVSYITKTKFIPKEITSEQEQTYIQQIKDLLSKEQDYKKTIDSLYAMFYTGEISQEVTITGGKTTVPQVPFINRTETPQITKDFKLSLLAEYQFDNTYGLGLGYNYKRLTIGAKTDNKNNFGVFGLWRFWR